MSMAVDVPEPNFAESVLEMLARKKSPGDAACALEHRCQLP